VWSGDTHRPADECGFCTTIETAVSVILLDGEAGDGIYVFSVKWDDAANSRSLVCLFDVGAVR